MLNNQCSNSIMSFFSVVTQGQTPLHWAVRDEREKFCSILLSAGSNVDCKDNQVMIEKYFVDSVLRVESLFVKADRVCHVCCKI